MKFNVIGYLIGEGFRNVFKNTKSTIACLCIMCATMIIFGIFFAVIENINNAIKQVEDSQGIEVFINKGTPEERMKEIGEQILALDGVNNIKFKTEEDAKNQMKQRFGASQYLIDTITTLKASYVVTFSDLSLSSQIEDTISKFDDVASVQSKQDTVNKLLRVANGIRITSIVIIVLLVLISIFIISNTIKLTVHARRKEISIMKYVGATNGFIKWPFIIEGIIIGIISAIITLLIVGVLYDIIIQNIETSKVLQTIGVTLLKFMDLAKPVAIVYSALGIGVGIVGSSMSMKKYLEV